MQQILKGDSAEYTLVKIIGSGCFAHVYSAIRMDTKEIVVVKETTISGLQEKQQQQANREAKLFKQISHANIVTCYDIFFRDVNNEKLMYTVMEKLDPLSAMDLQNMEQEDRNTAVLNIATDLLLAIEYLSTLGATSEGIVHRDIMETNVMAKKQGGEWKAKIIDFNMARETSGSGFTNFAGNQYHRAPECFGNKPQYSTASDLWAVGILLYILGCNEMPYEACDSMKTYNNSNSGQVSVGNQNYKANQLHLRQGVVRPVPDYLGEALRNLITGLLNNKQIDKRVSTMNQFLRDPKMKDEIRQRASKDQFIRLFPEEIQYIEKINGYGFEKKIKAIRKSCLEQCYVARKLSSPQEQLIVKAKEISSYDKDELESVKRRIQQIQKLNHKNLGKIIDIFQEKGFVYQVQEMLYPISCVQAYTGDNKNIESEQTFDQLNVHMQRVEVRNSMLMKVAIDLLLVIKYMQCKNISHGQITKDNVMIQNEVNQNFTTKLVNPNIDREIETCKCTFMGNDHYYMPPEYYVMMRSSDPLKFTTEMDLWQLGILLHEICTGKYPFSEKKNSFRLESVLPLPDELNPFIKSLINGLLSKDPTARIRIMDDFLVCDRNLQIVKQRASIEQVEYVLQLKKQNCQSKLEFSQFDVPIYGSNDDEYRIIKMISATNVTTIYMVENIKTKQLQVIKKISMAQMSEQQRERAKKEQTFLDLLKKSMLHHYCEFQIDEDLYIVFELLHPVYELHLQNLSAQTKTEYIRRIAFDLIQTAQYLQQKNVVHRDIYPQNVMVKLDISGDFVAKLVGYGHCILANEKNTEPIQNNKYQAPECQQNIFNHQTDLYAIGVVLSELAPPDMAEIQELIKALLNPDGKERDRKAKLFVKQENNKKQFQERFMENSEVDAGIM